MKAKSLRELLDAGLSGVIEYSLLRSVAAAESESAPEVLDRLACHVARQYASGAMTFADADSIMNAAFSVATGEECWAEHDRTVPEATYEVYQAFDAGEFHHRGDAADVDPELQYTKPLIERFLAARENGA